VLWSPFMEYRGSTTRTCRRRAAAGAWNPRTSRTGRTARPIHFDLGATWTWSIIRLEAGYQRLYFYSRTGLRRYYNADGSVTDYTLDFATADISGFYTGASVRF